MSKTIKNKKQPVKPVSVKTEAERVSKHPAPAGTNKFNPVYLLFGFAFLLYFNSLFNQYALDDRLMISDNAFTKKGVSGITDILTTDSFVGFFGKQKNLVAGGRYRPLSHITFALEYEIAGFSPFTGHLINVLMYAFACVLVYKVLKMLFPPGKQKFYLTISFLAAALFTAHPLHTEVVANIKGRDEIMSLLGSFGALYFVLKYAQNSRVLNLLWASLILFLGLMSKENAVTFVAIIPLSLYFFTKTPAKRIIVSTACLLVISTIFIIIRSAVLGFSLNTDIPPELLNNPFLNATGIQKFATILLTWGKYLLLLVFPHPLTHDYYPKQIPVTGMGDIRAILSLLVYAGLAAFAFMKTGKKHIISYCILFFGLSFSLSSNLVFPIGTFMNDRFMFVPLLGFCMVIAYIATEKFQVWFKGNAAQTATITVALIILLGYSVKTIARNPVWKDDYTLFTTDVKVSANSAKCNVSAGGQTLEYAEKEIDQVKKKKMISDAIIYLKKGVEIHPGYAVGYVLLGKAMIDTEDYRTAMQYYETALKINPRQKEALNNWLYCAQISTKNKDYTGALESYKKLITFQPSNKNLYTGLAGVYESMNRIDSAMNILNRLLALDSAYAPALSLMGELYGKHLNNIDKSLEYLLKAYSISPSDASVIENIGVAYGIKKDFTKSVEFFKKAIDAKPDNPQVYLNLAGSYFNLGDKQKAAECKAKAAELQKK